MANFDEQISKKTEELEKYRSELEKVKVEQERAQFHYKFYDDREFLDYTIDKIEEYKKKIIDLQYEIKKLQKEEKDSHMIKRGNIKVSATYDNARLSVENIKNKNGGIISYDDELKEYQRFIEKMKDDTNDYIRTASKIQELMDKLDYSSAIKKALPSLEKYNKLQDEFIQKNLSITDKDKLKIAQGLLDNTNKNSLDYFALNTEISKLQNNINKDIDSKNKEQEKEKTKLAEQQANERIRIAEKEHQKKMQFFEKEYIYKGKKYSTSEQLKYFSNYANDIKRSNNFIGLPDFQRQAYEQAMIKVRGLEEQLNKEQQQEDKKQQQKDKDKQQQAQKLNDLRKSFNNTNNKIVDDSNIETSTKKIEILQRLINRGFKNGDTTKLETLIPRYNELTNAVSKYEDQKTKIAEQQANERIRIAEKEHQEKMQFFDKEYIYSGKKYSTSEKLEYFTNYANDIKRSNNFIGMSDTQKQEYEQALSKVRSLTEQLNKEQQQQAKEAEQAYKQTVENIKNHIQQACNFIVSAVSKAIDIVKWTISSIGKVANGIINVFRSIGSIASRIIGLLGNFANRVRECTKTTNLLKGSWTELHSAISVVSGAINKLTNNTFISEGKKLLSSIETLNTLIGKDLTKNTIEWANNLESAFGVDAAGLISDMREVSGVLKGLGMSMEDTATASKNLVSVGQTMSAVIGLDTQTVMNKIYSGMRGMTQAIDDIGLSVREAQMDSFLKKLKAQGGEFANIGTSFSSLTEQQRVYVRYASLMDQFMSVYTPETYAKSLDSITGRLNIFNQRLRALKQLIGNFAIQIFNKFVMPLTYAVDVLTAKLKGVFSNIMGWMGLNPDDLDLSTGMNHTTVSAEDLADAYDDVAESAENANKASGGLDNWDKVSTIGSGSSSSSKDAFDYSKLMEYENDYAKKLEELAKQQENYTGKLKEAWDELWDSVNNKFNDWYTGLTGRKFDAKFNLKVNKKQIKEIAENIAEIFNKTFSNISGIGAMIIDDLNAGELLTKTLRLIERVTRTINKAIDKISPYIVKFYDKYISPYVEKFGDTFNNVIDKLLAKANFWELFWQNPAISKMWLDEKYENAGKSFEELKETVDKTIQKVKILGVLLKALFIGEISKEDQDILDSSKSAKSLNKVKDIFLDINGIVKTIQDISGELSIDFTDWFQNEGLDDIKDFVDKLQTTLSEHKDDIKQIIEKLGSVAWDVIKTIANKILDILDWLTEHPDEVCKTIETIGNVIKDLVDNLEYLVTAGILAKLTSALSPLLLLANISGLKGAITKLAGAGAIGAGGSAGAGAAGAGGATVADATGGVALFLPSAVIGALATLGIGAGVRGYSDTMSQHKVAKGVNESNKGKNSGFNTDDITNQAGATLKALRSKYGKNISDDIYNSVVNAYYKMLLNTEGIAEDQAKAYTKYFAYQLDQYSDSLNLTIGLATDTSKGEKQIGQFLNDIEKTVEYGSTEINESKNEIVNDINEIDNNLGTLSGSSSMVANTIKDAFSNISGTIYRFKDDIKSNISEIKQKFDSMKNLNSTISLNFKSNADTSNVKWTKGVKTNSLNSFGFANGGVPKSGSLFMANENGNTELVGNFGGYTGVANQGMILQAMKTAVQSGMTSALANNKTSNNGNINIHIDNMIGDKASLRQLAQMINNTNNSTNKTIANSAFSLG